MPIEGWSGAADVEGDVGGAMGAVGIETAKERVAVAAQVVDADLEAEAEGGGVASGSLEVAAEANEAGSELLI